MSQRPNLNYIFYKLFDLDHLIGQAWDPTRPERRGELRHKLEARGGQALSNAPVLMNQSWHFTWLEEGGERWHELEARGGEPYPIPQ